MTDSSGDIFKASPGTVAGIMSIGTDPARVWRPGELAAVFRHQMSAPVSVDLVSLGPAASGKLRVLTDAGGLLLKSFADLFRHPEPPLELLQLVKEFAKMNRDHPESAIPSEVATVLYYLSIAAALARCGKRITTLGDDALRQGFAWAKGQEWVDAPERELLANAGDTLAGREKLE